MEQPSQENIRIRGQEKEKGGRGMMVGIRR